MRMLRYSNTTVLLFVLLFGLLLSVVTTGWARIQVEVNGRALYLGVPPMQIQNRTMVPLRGVFESMGAQVDWYSPTRTISVTSGATNVRLDIGNYNANVDGRVVRLDSPAMIYHRSTMVPLRFVSEALGAEVGWSGGTQTVSISQHGSGHHYAHASNTRYNGTTVSNLVASIALYPDPLLAIMLPASTYDDQIIEANRLHFAANNYRDIDRQNWNISVRSLAHYPSVLRRMADDQEWTLALGQVYVEQPQVVMESIQILRRRSRSNGVLITNTRQRIYLQGEYVRIDPVQAEMIYVPQYDPAVVYVSERRANSMNLLSFSVGFAIGAWLCCDTDWSNHRVYNTGWQGGGWIANSRSYATTNNTTYNTTNIYMANQGQPVMVNRSISNRQVNLSRVRNYNLSPTLAPSYQATSSQSRINTSQQVTRTNIHQQSTQPHQMTQSQHLVKGSQSHVAQGSQHVTKGAQSQHATNSSQHVTKGAQSQHVTKSSQHVTKGAQSQHVTKSSQHVTKSAQSQHVAKGSQSQHVSRGAQSHQTAQRQPSHQSAQRSQPSHQAAQRQPSHQSVQRSQPSHQAAQRQTSHQSAQRSQPSHQVAQRQPSHQSTQRQPSHQAAQRQPSHQAAQRSQPSHQSAQQPKSQPRGKSEKKKGD